MDSNNSSVNQKNNLKRKRFFSFVFLLFKKRKKANDIDNLDKKLIYSLSPKKIPSIKQLKYAKKVLNSKEKIIFNTLILIIFFAFVFFCINFYNKNVVIYPVAGGEYSEGLVSSPKNINPLYDTARDVDSDIGRLVFSSLFKRNSEGKIVFDLVEDYSLSENGLEYIFKIKENVFWHHGERLDVDDIIFTLAAISNIEYGSPLRNIFLNTSFEKVDEYSFKIILKEVYPYFLESLTFGILPSDLWSNISPQNAFLNELNIKPIGSGPYKFDSLTKNKSGDIKEMSFIVNQSYYGQIPYINKINFKFFNNYNELIIAMNNNQIDALAYLPHGLKSELISQNSLNFNKLNLSQLSSLFLNSEKNSLLANKELRKNLSHLIDKNKIANEIFSGNVNPAYSPLFPSNSSYYEEIEKYDFDYEAAVSFLDEESWELLELNENDIYLIKNYLSLEQEEKDNFTSKDEIENWEAKINIVNNFSLNDEDLLGFWRFKFADNKYTFLFIELSTIDLVDNIAVAEFIKKSWEKAGIKTSIKIFNSNQIQSEIVKQKNFQALLLGQVISGEQDLYSFWHSSQSSEGGLNIIAYKNKEADKLLEEAMLSLNENERKEKYQEFQKIINEDFPVIFLYFPSYNYIQSKKIKGFDYPNILNPADRFNGLNNWYIKVNRKIEF